MTGGSMGTKKKPMKTIKNLPPKEPGAIKGGRIALNHNLTLVAIR